MRNRPRQIVMFFVGCGMSMLLHSSGHAAVSQIALNYNFNGIWHGDVEAMGDTEVSGFRSISDRALNFSDGVPANDVLDTYALVADANVLDMVHLGNRNLTDNGNWAFDMEPNDNSVGIQPDWLSDPDQSGPPATLTTLAAPILLDTISRASLIYQISNGGGDFEVRFGFSDGPDVVATLSGGDWFGGGGLPAGAFELFPGMGGVDTPSPDAPLGLWEGVVDLSSEVGRTLTSMAFENATNQTAGYGIYAVNVETIPEPASVLTLVLGTLGLWWLVRRQKH